MEIDRSDESDSWNRGKFTGDNIKTEGGGGSAVTGSGRDRGGAHNKQVTAACSQTGMNTPSTIYPLLNALTKKDGAIETGATTAAMQKHNKQQQTECLLRQQTSTQWITHKGQFYIPPDHWDVPVTVSTPTQGMKPSRLAMAHLAPSLLEEWSLYGCPTATGKNWTREEMQAAVF